MSAKIKISDDEEILINLYDNMPKGFISLEYANKIELIVNKLIQNNMCVSDNIYNDFINAMTKGKSRSCLGYRRSMILCCCKLKQPNDKQLDKIFATFSIKNISHEHEWIEQLKSYGHAFNDNHKQQLLKCFKYKKFTLDELNSSDITKEMFMSKIKFLKNNDIYNHSNIIIDCAHKNNIIIDNEFYDIIFNDCDEYATKFIIPTIKKYTLTFSEYIVKGIIKILIKWRNCDEFVKLFNEQTISFDNIKLFHCGIDTYSSVSEKYVVIFVKSAIDAIKNNGHNVNDYTWFINIFYHYNDIKFKGELKESILSNKVKPDEIKYKNKDLKYCYILMLQNAIKYNFIPTCETLCRAIKSNNLLLSEFCTYSNVDPSMSCFDASLKTMYGNMISNQKNITDYILTHAKTMVTEEHLIMACRCANIKYISIILNMKIIPTYKCVEICMHNEHIVKILCENGLSINKNIIELFIKKNIICLSFLHNVDKDIFDVCHYMNVTVDYKYIDAEHITLYNMINEYSTYEHIIEYANNNNALISKYHYDKILEYYALNNDNAQQYIKNAIETQKYKITTMSILRIIDLFDRYDLAKIFNEYLN
jgi:hypothetical protein